MERWNIHRSVSGDLMNSEMYCFEYSKSGLETDVIEFYRMAVISSAEQSSEADTERLDVDASEGEDSDAASIGVVGEADGGLNNSRFELMRRQEKLGNPLLSPREDWCVMARLWRVRKA